MERSHAGQRVNISLNHLHKLFTLEHQIKNIKTTEQRGNCGVAIVAN